ncbi:molybdopterin synthase subunit MoaD [Tamilnaduibacter salinus]|uniref:Molybdopterin synthase sulfur carrier subunit n=1 Tax=Tamilnaduibacter salinus TaxID=1484056 RepID=A0A2U1CXH4_9GAMM|nr:molybdopterin converting factor subunit 1 [Tamilnaduibacter salinus]PVY76915.1 molybdopterin synthase subunit MoaD [Tamilnaduibacter salinus]
MSDITITLRLFARLRETIGTGERTLTLPADQTIDALIHILTSEGAPWTALAEEPRLMIAVNQTMTGRDQRLRDGDEVALFPPVTGG